MSVRVSDVIRHFRPRQLMIYAVRGYQVSISPLLPPTCRYHPSCSNYAIEAIERHGALRGGWLAAHRLCRCGPWGGQGFDPVPPVAALSCTPVKVR